MSDEARHLHRIATALEAIQAAIERLVELNGDEEFAQPQEWIDLKRKVDAELRKERLESLRLPRRRSRGVSRESEVR